MDEPLGHYTSDSRTNAAWFHYSDIFHYIKLIEAKNGGFQALGREENEELCI